jgi:anti-sigma B factor antagonist
MVENINDITVVSIPEDTFDIGNQDRYVSEISTLLKPSAKAVIDLSRVRFMDSSGVGALLVCSRRAKAHGAAVKLCAPTDSVRQLFQMLNLDRVIEIHDSRQQAVKSFSC